MQDSKVLAVYSTKLTETQKIYLVMDKELLAIDKCLQAFSNMNKGADIFSHTDHKNLTYCPATNHRSQRVKRQMIYITDEYNVRKFKHISGNKNTSPDGISQLPIEECDDNKIYTNIKNISSKTYFYSI